MFPIKKQKTNNQEVERLKKRIDNYIQKIAFHDSKIQEHRYAINFIMDKVVELRLYIRSMCVHEYDKNRCIKCGYDLRDEKYE